MYVSINPGPKTFQILGPLEQELLVETEIHHLIRIDCRGTSQLITCFAFNYTAFWLFLPRFALILLLGTSSHVYDHSQLCGSVVPPHLRGLIYIFENFQTF